nr:MYB1 [Ipomoea batatas]
MDKTAAKTGMKKGAWTEEEDNLLRKYIEEFGEGKWHQVPAKAGRTANDVKNYWNTHLKKTAEFGMPKPPRRQQENGRGNIVDIGPPPRPPNFSNLSSFLDGAITWSPSLITSDEGDKAVGDGETWSSRVIGDGNSTFIDEGEFSWNEFQFPMGTSKWNDGIWDLGE